MIYRVFINPQRTQLEPPAKEFIASITKKVIWIEVSIDFPA